MLGIDYSYYIEAEYESGYVHREMPEDHSPYVRGKNIFNDILEKRPEAIHGPMVRFTLVMPGEQPNTVTRHNVDWTKLDPKTNPRPIRFKHFSRSVTMGEGAEDDVDTGPVLTGVDFGYQWTDSKDSNQEEVIQIR